MANMKMTLFALALALFLAGPELVRPTAAAVQWYEGFDVIKPGEPRCGSQAPPLNGKPAICNPNDDLLHCCSPYGYCGTGPAFCDCPGCKDAKKLV